MKRPAASPRLAVALGGVASALLAANACVPLIWPEVAVAGWSGSPTVLVVDALGLLGAVVVGTLIAVRRPGNRYGWLLLSLGLVGPLAQLLSAYATFALLVAPGDAPLGWPAAWLAGGLWVALVSHLPLLLLLFPDGQPPSPPWGRLAWAILAAAAVALAAAPFVPGELGVVPVNNPYGASGGAGTAAAAAIGIAVFGIFAAVPVAGAAVVVRWRRAVGQTRLQLKWFLYAAALLGAEILVTGAGAFVASDLVNSILLTLALSGVFAAIGVAVLRYRLYEIDRIVSRTVTYAAVTAVLVGVYAGGVVAIRAVLAPVTGESDLAVAGSTLAVAALFGPLRRRIQALVDRRFNRRRYDAARAAERFGQRLRDQVDLDDVALDLRSTVAATVAPTQLSLWLPPKAGAT